MFKKYQGARVAEVERARQSAEDLKVEGLTGSKVVVSPVGHCEGTVFKLCEIGSHGKAVSKGVA